MRRCPSYTVSSLSALLAFLLLAGCVSAPSLPSIEQGAISRVGVYVAEIGQPSQTHVGTTIFNNNAKEYDLGWDLKTEFLDLINKEVVAAGLEAVDLAGAGYSGKDFPVVEVADGAGFSVTNPGSLQRLSEDGVDAIITVAQLDRILAQMSCTQFGCSEQWAENYGIYTRRFMGIGHATALFAFDVRVETTAEAVSLTQTKEMQHFATWPQSSRKLEKMPETIAEVDEESWERVRTELHAALRERVSFALALLNGADAEQLKASAKENSE